MVAAFLIGILGPVFGSSTQDLRIEGSAAFLEGKFSGTGLNDLGELVMGLQAGKTMPVEDAAYILSSAKLGNKTCFGAGYPASVFVYDGKSTARSPATFPGDFAVSAVASDGRHLYAASMPSTAIYKIDDKGNTTAFADFSTGATTPNYVWALAVHRGSLYAALGGHFPSVYKVDLKTGKKELLQQVDGKAKNVTALLVEEEAIYFGDDIGRVFRLGHSGGSRASVLYSFSDAEIKSIVPFDGGIAVGVNSRRFVPPPPPPQAMPGKEGGKPGEESMSEGGEYGIGAELKKAVEQMAATIEDQLRETVKSETIPSPAETAGTAPVPADRYDGKPPPPPSAAKPESPAAQGPAMPPVYQDPFGKGEGNLFWMASDGTRVHRLWSSPSSVVLSIHPADQGVWVATSNPGRLYRIAKDGSERLFYESTSKDLSVVTDHGKELIAAASNPASVLVLHSAAVGEYSSKVFDAGFPARIGKPELTGPGSDHAEILYRSGATPEIDSGWSDFKVLSGAAPQSSGRFLQAKLKLKSPGAAIRRVRLPHRVQNLYPRLVNLSAEVVRSQDGSTDGQDIRFQWDAVNLDNDVLLYQLSYQHPGARKFIPVYAPADRPRNVKILNLPAEQFTDGTYRFRLEVTDEPSNGAAEALTNQAEFPLVLLDRTPPVVELWQEGGTVRWQATDAESRIVRAEYRIDGGVWDSLQSDDGLFDSLQESGRVTVSDRSGGVIDVRSFDERDNSRNYSLILK